MADSKESSRGDVVGNVFPKVAEHLQGEVDLFSVGSGGWGVGVSVAAGRSGVAVHAIVAVALGGGSVRVGLAVLAAAVSVLPGRVVGAAEQAPTHSAASITHNISLRNMTAST